MSSCRERLLKAAAAAALVLSAAGTLAQTTTYPGIGRPATVKEVQAWDIDVRPDFKGLPKGSGTVAKGMDVWEAKCASCHGIFGESNEIFSPLIGGTTADDIKTGRVAKLLDPAFPGRTTLMKVPTVATLWDYINRAMPWNQPKSLSTEEVYAVTAFMLNLGGVLPDNFTLSDQNIAEVQKRMPNRNGMSTDHGLWPGRSLGNGGRPDVKAVACMSGCATEATVASFLPDHARNAHGNLAEQNRMVGAQHGADTTRPAGAPITPGAAPAAPPGPDGTAASTRSLLTKHNCLTCHGVDRRVVGPGLEEIARKYTGQSDALSYLTKKIVEGSTGVWGAIPMPPQTLPAADAQAIAKWLADGARK